MTMLERQSLLVRERRQVDVAQVAGRDEIDAGFRAAAQHEAAQPDIGPAGRGIDGEIHRGRDVGASVAAVLKMDRKPREVGGFAVPDHLLNRRVIARDLDDLGLDAEPAHDLGAQLLRGDAERAGKARPASHDVADQRLRLGTGALEQDRTGIAFERGRDLRQLGRIASHLELAVALELVEEPAQPELVEIKLHDGPAPAPWPKPASQPPLLLTGIGQTMAPAWKLHDERAKR